MIYSAKIIKKKYLAAALIIFIMMISLSGCRNNEQNENNNNIEQGKSDIVEKENEKDINEEMAKKKLSEMSLEEKIGQIFLVRCPLADDVDNYMSMNPGGLILFGRDFKEKTKSDVINDIKNYQLRSKIPLIIGVDEEGGTVVRVSSNPLLSDETFKSPQELYGMGGFDAVYDDAYEKSKLLLSLGINLNLAPVADVSTNKNDFIYQRSFGKGAEETSEYVKTVVKAMSDAGISSTLKHFPGYGNNADTHTGSAVDKRPYENFVSKDFLPFEEGIKSGTDAVLVSHNIIESIDSELPASLSKKVIDILKDELKFNGVIITDDMSMAAVAEMKTETAPEVLAVLAGCHMIIVSDFEKSYSELLNSVNSGEVKTEQIDEAVLKILKWKYSKKIIAE